MGLKRLTTARLTYNIIARLTQARLANESSLARYFSVLDTTSRERNFLSDTPRANHLKRYPANESSPEMSPQCNTVTRCVHEILSRHTVTKYVHEVRLIVIQQDDRKSITQQQQMHDRHVQHSQLNV